MRVEKKTEARAEETRGAAASDTGRLRGVDVKALDEAPVASETGEGGDRAKLERLDSRAKLGREFDARLGDPDFVRVNEPISSGSGKSDRAVGDGRSGRGAGRAERGGAAGGAGGASGSGGAGRAGRMNAPEGEGARAEGAKRFLGGVGGGGMFANLFESLKSLPGAAGEIFMTPGERAAAAADRDCEFAGYPQMCEPCPKEVAKRTSDMDRILNDKRFSLEQKVMAVLGMVDTWVGSTRGKFRDKLSRRKRMNDETRRLGGRPGWKSLSQEDQLRIRERHMKKFGGELKETMEKLAESFMQAKQAIIKNLR